MKLIFVRQTNGTAAAATSLEVRAEAKQPRPWKGSLALCKGSHNNLTHIEIECDIRRQFSCVRRQAFFSILYL